MSEAQGKVAYSFYTEFQSHEPEFDYLKSLEIEEKINSIRWCHNRGPNSGIFLISIFILFFIYFLFIFIFIIWLFSINNVELILYIC